MATYLLLLITTSSHPVAAAARSGTGSPFSNDARYPPNCAGYMYTIQDGDTCGSVSLAHSVGTDRMIYDNAHPTYTCDNFSPGTDICIQHKCPLATVEKGMTCDRLAGEWLISRRQLVLWNPTLSGLSCDTRFEPNLDFMLSRHVCVRVPRAFDLPPAKAESIWDLYKTPGYQKGGSRGTACEERAACAGGIIAGRLDGMR
ncbi:hypothetical protein QBC43DRAFT_289616 [Cladorrhinum sp. PSN259]|nr:hypothetical protein QBC43DRAFT_289616 [Cladorrhinum sp. PSN259]